MDNYIKSLNNLPQNLKVLNCAFNQLYESTDESTFLEYLPKNLENLKCNGNKFNLKQRNISDGYTFNDYVR
jgi:Leucine-rich repeat (LRR) protein